MPRGGRSASAAEEQDAYLLHPTTMAAHRCRVAVDRRGLFVRRLGDDPDREAVTQPLLVPWWAISGFSADQTLEAPEGTVRQVVEVVTDAGALFLLLSAVGVSVLLARVAHRTPQWRLARHPWAAAVARRWAIVDSHLGPAHVVLGALGTGVAAMGRAVATVWNHSVAPTWRAVRWVGHYVALVVGAALVAVFSWPLAFARLLSMVFVAPLCSAIARSLLGRAVVAAWRAADRTFSDAWAGLGAALVTLSAPLRTLVRPPLRWMARTTAPARDRVAASFLGLAAAALFGRAAAAGASVGSALSSPRHTDGRGARTRFPFALTTGMLSLLMTAAAVLVVTDGGSLAPAAARTQAQVTTGLSAAGGADGTGTSSMGKLVSLETAKEHAPLNLPAATAAPAPAPPTVANQAPLTPHEVFGFAPYWTLPQSTGFDVNGLTTIAYFSIGVNADGTLAETGSGWNGYESQAFANLVTRAHAAGDRVVLTVNCFGQSTLNGLTSSQTAPATLSAAILKAIEAKNLDGVNIDFEGEGSADQVGLTNLITQVSAAVHAANPHYQVTMDTYASSAGDPDGFYNIKALAPAVDGFFVMAYQLNLEATTTPASPLTSSMFSDLTTAEQYAAAVTPAKVILGVPYYGYDWPTNNGTMAATATGGATPITYGQVVASGHPIYWDAVTDTAWTSYEVNGQWHEDYFENPTSLYMATQMAQMFRLDGMGIWALGMDGNSPQMLAALDGNAPPTKITAPGPTSTTPSSSSTTTTSTTTTTAPLGNGGHAPGSTTTTTPTTTAPPPTTTTTAPGGATGFRYTGQWDGQTATLSLVTTAKTVLTGTATLIGQLTGFQTTNPAYACLESASSLNVWQFGSAGTQDVVMAAKPADCVTAVLTFPAPKKTTGGSGTSGSGTSGSGSSTTGSAVTTGASTAVGQSSQGAATVGGSSLAAGDRPRRTG